MWNQLWKCAKRVPPLKPSRPGRVVTKQHTRGLGGSAETRPPTFVLCSPLPRLREPEANVCRTEEGS